MMGQKFLRLTVLSASLLALTSGTSFSQQVSTSSAPLYDISTPAPDVSNVPVFQNIIKTGAKLFYMGERSGVYGYFIIKDGQIQMIYLTADKKTTLVGGMFSTEGENITSKQISRLVEQNSEVKALLGGAARQQSEVLQAGSQQGGAASVPATASAASGAKDGMALPAASSSPGERLMADLNAASGVVLGNNPQAQLHMVVAPGCPNCKRTWAEIRPYVKEGSVEVRLIPVYNSTGDEEKNAAAQLLRIPDPMGAWDKFVEGDKTALGGAPDPVALRAVTDNLGLVAKWNIQGYPYLVYRGKDGRIKIVQGRPDRMAAVLADIIK